MAAPSVPASTLAIASKDVISVSGVTAETTTSTVAVKSPVFNQPDGKVPRVAVNVYEPATAGS